MITYYDSIEQFATTASTPQAQKHVKYGATSFTGDMDYNTVVSYAKIGNESYVAPAMALIDQLADTLPETKVWERVYRPHGTSVAIGRYLAGLPYDMRLRKRMVRDTAPLKIVVCLTSSAGISAKSLLVRGTAILAMTLKLAAMRPVELWLLSELDGKKDGSCYQMIKVQTQPLSIGTAAFALCACGFDRQLCHTMARMLDKYKGQWPAGYLASSTGTAESYKAIRRKRLGLLPEDLVIEPAWLYDESSKNPIKWINDHLIQHGAAPE